MDNKNKEKKYTNEDLTVVWKPDLCIHSAVCVQGLPSVFDVKARPWIDLKGSKSEEIISQINKCPSGALSYFKNEEESEKENLIEFTRVEVAPNGPLMVFGSLSVKGIDQGITHKEKVTAFCRCGASSNKPYCDGSHKNTGFTD